MSEDDVPVSPSIVGEGTVPLASAFDMLLLHVKPRPVFAAVGLLLVILAIGACFLPSRTVGGRGQEPSYTLPFTLTFLFLYAFAYVPWNLRRLYFQSPTRGRSTRCEVSDSGITIKSSRGEARLPWSDFRRWRANRKVVLLYSTDANFLGFPSHFFGQNGSFAEFQSLVRKHLGEAR